MEIWRDIKGYEGLYQVSNKGRVKRFYKNGNEHILEPNKTADGYMKIKICKNGKPKTCTVHRLVAEAFIPNPNNLPTVNHKDEFAKDDNCVENLEWMSHKEQINYGTRTQRMAKSKGKAIIGINKKTGEKVEFYSCYEAERQLGIANQSINSCCKGKRKSAGGYIWKYKEEY